MTTLHEDDKLLNKFKDLGLGSSDAVRIIELLDKEQILKEYDFGSLKPDAKGMYRIWVSDVTNPDGKKRLYAKNIENLKDKVYRFIKRVPDTKAHITFKFAFSEAQKYEQDNTTPERQISRNNTIDRNASEYRRFFKDTDFEGKFIDKITVRDLDELIRFNCKRYRLTKSGRNSLRTLLNMTFKRAYNLEWIDDNPTRRIVWRDYDRLLYVSAPIIYRAYTDNDIEAMLKLDRQRQKERPSFITAYAHEFQCITGFRRAEVCPLLWKDINLEKGFIYVHQEQLVDRKNHHKPFIVDYTKTHKDRFYAIADQEQAFFEKLLKIHDKYYPDSPFLFPGNTENGCISCDAVETYHQRSCGKLNIPISMEFKRGPHAFRRTRITEVVNNTGGNVVLAAQMYGNSPETIRKNYYTCDTLENQRAALNCRKVI